MRIALIGAGSIADWHLAGLHAAGVTAAVVAALPERTSGSDIREVVRRAVLAGEDGSVCTATLLGEIGNGRYRAAVPAGLYL